MRKSLSGFIYKRKPICTAAETKNREKKPITETKSSVFVEGKAFRKRKKEKKKKEKRVFVIVIEPKMISFSFQNRNAPNYNNHCDEMKTNRVKSDRYFLLFTKKKKPTKKHSFTVQTLPVVLRSNE